MSKREVVVVGAKRTAIGAYGGSLKGKSAGELGGLVVKAALEHSGLSAKDIGHCVMGSVTHADKTAPYVSRIAALQGGLNIETPALTVNRLCGSGLQAVITASQQILLGDCDSALAGGTENMTDLPYWAPHARWGMHMGHGQFIDPLISVLTCPFNDYHMGVTAENINEQYDISRADQDAHAIESHRRAAAAIDAGYFKEQIVPVELITRRGVSTFDCDEHVKADTSLEALAKMRPAFQPGGSVTAGNASGINDAAAAVVLTERSVAETKGLEVLGRLVGYTVVGVDPAIMGIAPVHAITALLQKTGVAKESVGIWELNEAFAGQALAVCRELNLPMEAVNPNGSGISLGHPIGATGALMVVKALYELKRTQTRYAVVSMCVGGGQGIAALFERDSK